MISIAHPLPEVYERKHGKINDLRSITHNPKRGEDWIATTTTLFNPNDGLIYAGLTSRDGDILYSYDRSTGKATCCDYLSVRVEGEIKVHRSLELGPDGKLYSGSAGLVDRKTRDAHPGGQLWSYDPATGEYDVFGIPVPHDYVQHITVDFVRQVMYGGTYPTPWFFAFDLKTRTTKKCSYSGALPHRSVVADDGKVWSGYSMSMDLANGDNMLMTYDPDTNDITYHDFGLPMVGTSDPRQIDDMVNLGDGYIYASTVSGGFSRINPKTCDIEWYGKPSRGMRLAGIDEAPDGRLFITTGAFYGMHKDDAPCHVFAVDRDTKQFYDYGIIEDPDFGDGCQVVHHLSIDDEGTLWVGETDTHNRSGCLWECHLED